MTLKERLRQLASALPSDDSAVTMTRADLVTLLQGDIGEVDVASTRDLTVEEVAKETGRAPSTVRDWLISGALCGYKLNGRDWRVARSALRQYLEAQATKVEKADTTLDQLRQLQDRVLAQSDSVVDAIETLELSVDMQKQMQLARHTFDEFRRMLTEVVIMEPTVRQAMQSLQPLTALGNLRRLSVAELREAASFVSHRRHALDPRLRHRLHLVRSQLRIGVRHPVVRR